VKLLAQYRKGESDLILRDGVFYLLATLDEDTPEEIYVDDVLGVDLGIENIAYTSDGEPTSGQTVKTTRRNYQRTRKELQSKNTKSSKRRAARRSGKEARFTKDVNHCVSKQLVAMAQRTGRAIALEDLTGIRERVRLRKPQRATFHSWSFAQLAAFIVYKAQRAGVPVYFVNPAYTSQRCSACHHTDKRNRPNQSTFQCKSCGVSLHADHNAALNIAQLGAVNLPDAARASHPVMCANASPTL
jgi:IS605 OrfB family transposase